MQATFENKQYFQLKCLAVRGFRGYLPMYHPHGELVYVTEGRLTVTADGCRHTLQPGQAGLIFPYLTHAYESAPDSRVIIALFDPAATVFDNTLLSFKPERFHAQTPELQPVLERMLAMHRRNKPKTAMAYLNAALGELLEQLTLEQRDNARESVLVQLLTWCSNHFTENITVKTAADALYLSESYVSKLFSQKLRCSFREYINAMRIQKACALLQTSNRKILQIMTQCGFQNQSSFNRVFRSHCGVSPQQYRAAKKQE